MKKILIIRSDRFGEFLLSLPAIKLVKDNFPQSSVSVMAKDSNIELVRGIDFIDKFIVYDKNFSKNLKKENFDCVLILNPKKEFHLAAFLAGIPLRVGYDRKWGWCLNRKIKDLKHLEQKHEVEYNIELVNSIVSRGAKFCAPTYIPDVDLPFDSKESLDFLKDKIDLSKQYIVMHPFTSNPSKKVDRQFWHNLSGKCRGMINHAPTPLVLLGSDEEKEDAEGLAREIGAINLAGNLTLRNLATFLKYNCRSFVGLDSGPLHLASLLKIPVVGLYNQSNPRRWAPYRTKSLVLQGKVSDDFINQIDKIIDFILRG